MNTFKTIKLESAAHITTLSFKRSQKSNSITPEFMDELEAAADHVCQDSETRCLIITGAGRAFCSGLDLEVLNHWASCFATG